MVNAITGVLLANLGTPLSPRPSDVKRYLIEFLTDKRVIDIPWWKRQLLVRAFIVPRRYRQSAQAYSRIWTPEGSPLLVHSRNLRDKLQSALGPRFKVALGMRYQIPSLEQSLKELLQSPLRQLIILPLFPQYASATTGSVHAHIMKYLQREYTLPHLTFIDSYSNHPAFIRAWQSRAHLYDFSLFDHILISFHGLPVNQLVKADRSHFCQKEKGCCLKRGVNNYSCYSAQCYATGLALAKQLELAAERYTITFQSRLGSDKWLEPYTIDVLHRLAAAGKKRILVFCPAFTCDCLETLYEIGVEYEAEFKKAGGEALQLVEGLNDSPLWVDALKEIIEENTSRYAFA